MAKRKHRDDGRVAVTHREEPVKAQEPEVDRTRTDGWADTPLVDKKYNRCPECGSIRSRMFRGGDYDKENGGRTEYRICDCCHARFRLNDKEWTVRN